MIYLDYAATTPVISAVWNEMKRFATCDFYNPSSNHHLGKIAGAAVQNARELIAHEIGANYDEIYFTSGATEANNLALKGVMNANRIKGNHIITTVAEHSSVFDTCQYLQTQGFEVDYVGIDKLGVVNESEIMSLIKPTTILVSVMFANNEIGSINPIRQIGRMLREKSQSRYGRILFHTDAVQAFGKIPINVDEYCIDLMSVSGHKIYGPKGIGVLYKRGDVKCTPMMHGGGQERALRSGTLNSPAIVGMACAVEHYAQNRNDIVAKEKMLRDRIISGLCLHIPDIVVNGTLENRLCNNVNVSVPYVDHSQVFTLLDLGGICVSMGSACSSGDVQKSRTIRHLHANWENDINHANFTNSLCADDLNGAIRITCSYLNDQTQIDEFITKFSGIIKKLRR